MDDAEQPQVEAGDEAGVPSAEEPVSQYAPAPPDEVAPRLDLDADPFAPKPALSAPEPEPLIAALETPAEPVAPEAADLEATAADETASAPEPTPEPAEPEPAESPLPEADLSLDDMVGELSEGESDAEGADADGEAAEADAAAEAEAVEGETTEAGEGEPAEEPSWLDTVADATIAAPVAARYRLSTRVPFWVYGGAWALFAGAMTYLLWPLSGTPFVDSIYYAYFVYGGAGMIAIGAVTGVVVLLAARTGSTPAERIGLGRSVGLRTAGWMAVGVVLWWACLYALDLHRAGVIG